MVLYKQWWDKMIGLKLSRSVGNLHVFLLLHCGVTIFYWCALQLIFVKRYDEHGIHMLINHWLRRSCVCTRYIFTDISNTCCLFRFIIAIHCYWLWYNWWWIEMWDGFIGIKWKWYISVQGRHLSKSVLRRQIDKISKANKLAELVLGNSGKT